MTAIEIHLEATNKDRYIVPIKVAQFSGILKNMIADLIIPFPETSFTEPTVISLDVDSEILKNIILWCKHHIENPGLIDFDGRKRFKYLTDWDMRFFARDQVQLGELLKAANYLDLRCLIDSLLMFLASRIQGKTTREIRSIFNKPELS